MSFLILSNIDIQLRAKKLTWRSYTSAKALPTARGVEIIDKHKFAKAALDKNSETFVIHVPALEVLQPAMLIHFSRAPLLAALQKKKAPTEIFSEYVNYIDFFSFDLAIELPENTSINKNTIELIESK